MLEEALAATAFSTLSLVLLSLSIHRYRNTQIGSHYRVVGFWGSITGGLILGFFSLVLLGILWVLPIVSIFVAFVLWAMVNRSLTDDHVKRVLEAWIQRRGGPK